MFSFKGILIDDAEIILANQECYNGIIHVIDKVLVEPEDDLMSIIRKIKDIRYPSYSEQHIGLNVRKHVFGVSDKARLKAVSSATETS